MPAAEQAALEELGKGSGDGYTDAMKAALDRERRRQENLGDLVVYVVIDLHLVFDVFHRLGGGHVRRVV